MESLLFRPPPRITLKLKMPKLSLGKGKGCSKSGNGPLCPDNSGNLYNRVGGGMGQGKPQLHHGRVRKEGRTNGLMPAMAHSHREGGTSSGPTLPVKPSGKPLALYAALQGHSSGGKGKGDQDWSRPPAPPKSNGFLEKSATVGQRDTSCQTPSEPDARDEVVSTGGKGAAFRKSTMEHFSRSFKEATVSLVRTTEDLRGLDKASRKGSSSAKERLWVKPAGERRAESDGYCPDLELSDSESEAKGKKRQRPGRAQAGSSPAGGDSGKGGGKGGAGAGLKCHWGLEPQRCKGDDSPHAHLTSTTQLSFSPTLTAPKKKSYVTSMPLQVSTSARFVP